MSAVSVEPIYDLLAASSLLTDAQTEWSDGLWDDAGNDRGTQTTTNE